MISSSSERGSKPVARSVRFVQTHFGRQITLDDMAAAAGISKFHFSREFKAHTGLAPGDIGSRAASLSVILDDPYGFTLSSGPNGWVAEFGFYTETLRKDTVIPMQIRDLKALLLNSGETHVAWVWLVADIADNRVNTYISK